MYIMLQATAADMAAGTALETELDKAKEWLKANPGAPISDYNAQLSDRAGVERIRFFPMRVSEATVDVPAEDRLQALVLDGRRALPVLAGGKEIAVLGGYGAIGAPKSDGQRFLQAIATRAYDEDVFSVVLTPAFDRAHRNHFHLDLARYRVDGTGRAP